MFSRHGVKIVGYADDFVLMGKELREEAIEKLKSLLTRMGLTLNETKLRQIDAKTESFDFLGFTFRYDKDLHGRNSRYWNIMPSKKSEKKIREKIRLFLSTHGHYNATEVAKGLNVIIRGWLNYFEIKTVSYPMMSKRKLRYYLSSSLYRYYKRKSQRKCRLYGQNAFKVLTTEHGLIDPSKYAVQLVKL